MRRTTLPTSALKQRRSGAALLEVLIAILAMGIGVVSLMSLFPLSVLRTAQAHQLTVGAGVRLNAEALLDSHPTMWVNPDNNPLTAHAAEHFILDPLGYARVGSGPIGSLNRYNAGLTTTSVPNISDRMTYDGNWVSQAEENGLSVAGPSTSLTFGATVDLTAVPNPTGPIPSRIILFDATGKFSTTRKISSITGNTVNWADSVTFTVTRARVETRDEQFSWLLSMIRSDDATHYIGDAFLAVFFRREFSTTSETPLGYGAANVFVAGSTSAAVTYTGDRPAIRKGGYVFDSVNGYWYRINDYQESGNTITMNLEFPAQKDSNGAVFFRGLVDVYYLGTKRKAK